MSQFQPLPRFLASRVAEGGEVVAAADVALVAKVLAGCPVARSALGDRMQCIPTMVRARRRAVAPWIPAAALPDLEQHVALRVLECLPSFRGLATLESWIYAFCEGAVRNAGRRHRRDDRPGPLLELAAATEVPAPATTTPLELAPCLDHLGHADRELVRGRHWQGLGFAQLAVRFGVPRNTIKSRYHRAIKQLKACLQRRGHPPAAP